MESAVRRVRSDGAVTRIKPGLVRALMPLAIAPILPRLRYVMQSARQCSSIGTVRQVGGGSQAGAGPGARFSGRAMERRQYIERNQTALRQDIALALMPLSSTLGRHQGWRA